MFLAHAKLLHAALQLSRHLQSLTLEVPAQQRVVEVQCARPVALDLHLFDGIIHLCHPNFIMVLTRALQSVVDV